MKNEILDLLGKKVIITDLDKAIEQARCFSGYDGSVFVARGISAKMYWQDIYTKLLSIHSKTKKQSSGAKKSPRTGGA